MSHKTKPLFPSLPSLPNWEEDQESDDSGDEPGELKMMQLLRDLQMAKAHQSEARKRRAQEKIVDDAQNEYLLELKEEVARIKRKRGTRANKLIVKLSKRQDDINTAIKKINSFEQEKKRVKEKCEAMVQALIDRFDAVRTSCEEMAERDRVDMSTDVEECKKQIEERLEQMKIRVNHMDNELKQKPDPLSTLMNALIAQSV